MTGFPMQDEYFRNVVAGIRKEAAEAAAHDILSDLTVWADVMSMDTSDPYTELPKLDPDDEPTTAEEARLALAEALGRLEEEGRTIVGLSDIGTSYIGRSWSWVARQLAALAQAGRLSPTSEPGRYRIVPRY